MGTNARGPLDESALGGTLPRVPDIPIEVNRLVAYSTPHVMPFLWAIGDELDAFEEALADDETVGNGRVLGRMLQRERDA